MGAEAFFEADGDGYRGLWPARGPWSADHCHAGPVAGLIARALEQAVDDDKVLVRLSVDLVRPVQLVWMSIVAKIVRSGRTVTTAKAVLRDQDGRDCVTASALFLAPVDLGEVPSIPAPALDFDAAKPGEFPLQALRHGLPGFAAGVEIRFPTDPGPEGGPVTLWMKTPPLLADEAMSPFQTLCPLADCGNGIAPNGDLESFSFLNADLSIHMHRAPKGEWLGAEAYCHWHHDGVGVSHMVLHDRKGPVAVALQTIVLRRV